MNYSDHDPARNGHGINDVPAPPQHRDLVNNNLPEMSRGGPSAYPGQAPAYPGQQSYYSPNPNPFNDSNAALSQMSQRSSRTSSVFGGPSGMAMDPRHAAIRGYSDSVHSGSSDSQQYAMDHLHRGQRASNGAYYPPYSDNPYNRYSSIWDNSVEQPFNPDEIADDGDDGLGPPPSQSGRRSALKSRSNQTLPIAAGAGAAAAATGVEGSQGFYGPVSAADRRIERDQMLAAEASSRKKKRVAFIILGFVVILAVIAAGTVAGVLLSRKSNAGSSGKTAAQDDASLLNKNSAEIQALMNNKNLHRVFPGMDYTPLNAQYPACLTNPPSQNNVTRDIAVLNQLTNVIRLYGTDCNQTDMILTSLDYLGITDMKIWLAVWLDSNSTTNDRGMNAMWDILSRKGQAPFAGVIIGNEVLYRKDLTLDQLTTTVSQVRSNFTKNGYTLPIAIADLGDNWTSGLASIVDVVMSNVHPFFAGVTAEEATDWTISFWQSHDVELTQGTTKKNIISETGWPSEGGNDCGGGTCTSSTQGAVASIPNMNTFMEGFVCPALKNGTDYFWFEAFDEPWKVQFNTPTDNWETHWGLMDENRNLKSGVQIPDCDGQTVKQNW